MPVSNADSMLKNEKISPDGKYLISHAEVKIKKVTGITPHYDSSILIVKEALCASGH